MDGALDALRAALDRPLLVGTDTTDHVRPWRGEPGHCLAVARPRDLEEVRAVVRWCRRHRVRLLPQGANTGLVGASTPPPHGPAPLILSTDALRRNLEVRPLEAVAVADAGVRLSELNEAASVHGLELPIDLAADPALGAMVATNTGGSRLMRHGDMSRWVLGAQVVIADHDASVLGDVRGLQKDNTGPDPTRLLIGSAGAFGIITAVSLRLSPVPAQRTTALVGPLSDVRAVSLLGELRGSLGDELSAFEVMCPAALRAATAVTGRVPGLEMTSGHEVTALVEASGSRGVRDALVTAVERAGCSGIALEVPLERAWRLRHGISEGLRRSGRVVGFDLSVHTGQLPALRDDVRRLVARRPALEVADFGHWGDGGIHCNLVVPHGVDLSPDEEQDLRDAVYATVSSSFGGSFSAEHGIGATNARWWRHSTPEPVRAALRAHRAAVDPLGILGHPALPF